MAVTALEQALSRLAREGSSTSGSLRTVSTAMPAASAAHPFRSARRLPRVSWNEGGHLLWCPPAPASERVS